MVKPLLIVFLGFPGSGKTYFATRLAKKISAVTLNSDALRLSMFGSLERIEEIRRTDNARLYVDVFGAMNYAAGQALQAGHSVVYDAQQTKRENRLGIEKIAKDTGAIPVLVWIKTSPEVAARRGQERETRADSHQYTTEKMTYLVNRFEKVTDLPETEENVIEISGELPFEEQLAIFEQKVEAIRHEQTE
jgi:predicted kinase